MKKILILLFLSILGILSIYYFNPFGAPSKNKTSETYVVPQNFGEAIVLQNLKKKGFVKSFWALDIALTIKNKHDKIQSGGYYLSKNMNAWQIADKISSGPDLKWITFPEGLRKEQIGERLQKLLGWTNLQLDEWNNLYKMEKTDYFEGVYFPDTYLFPIVDNPVSTSVRMIGHFSEKVKTQLNEFADQDIRWTTGLKIASIIQREAGGTYDMPIIAGVIWNRLNAGQKLQMDAEIQYAKGKAGDKWWSQVTSSDIKTIDSPFNSYKYKGLPPNPIANPGIDAINAVLHPAETDCFYYLHDHNRQIHCSVTYEEHLGNIKKYLD